MIHAAVLSRGSVGLRDPAERILASRRSGPRPQRLRQDTLRVLAAYPGGATPA